MIRTDFDPGPGASSARCPHSGGCSKAQAGLDATIDQILHSLLHRHEGTSIRSLALEIGVPKRTLSRVLSIIASVAAEVHHRNDAGAGT